MPARTARSMTSVSKSKPVALAPQEPESLAQVLRLLAQEPPEVSLSHMALRFPPVSQFLERFRALLRQRSRFDFETEVMLRAVRAGMDVVGVPVEVHYPPAQERTSHYRPWEDTLRIVATVLRVLGESIPGAFARPHRFR